MSRADYYPCDACGRKAYYDADVDYDDAAVYALCGQCAKQYRMVLETKETSDD